MKHKYGEESCGTIIFNKDKTEILLIKEGDKWQCPKGMREKGETQKQTAIRETYEEVGIQLKEEDLGKKFIVTFQYPITAKMLEEHLQEIKGTNNKQYLFKGIRHRKIVLFVVLTNKKKIKIQQNEVDDAKWVTIQDALKLMSTSKQKPILLSAIKYLNITV